MDDDIHFRNEERKRNWVVECSWWRMGGKAATRRGRGRKNASLGSNQSGWRTAACFSLTPGSGGDRRLRMRMCARLRVFMCVCMLCRGSSVSVSWGCGRTWEKALVARKKQSAVLKQYQLCGSHQGDQSMTQSNKGEKNNNKKGNKV